MFWECPSPQSMHTLGKTNTCLTLTGPRTRQSSCVPSCSMDPTGHGCTDSCGGVHAETTLSPNFYCPVPPSASHTSAALLLRPGETISLHVRTRTGNLVQGHGARRPSVHRPACSKWLKFLIPVGLSAAIVLGTRLSRRQRLGRGSCGLAAIFFFRYRDCPVCAKALISPDRCAPSADGRSRPAVFRISIEALPMLC